MYLGELVGNLIGDVQVSLYEGDTERHICFTKKSWLGIEPYLERKVVTWEIIHASSDESQIRVVLLNKGVESAIDQLKDIAPKPKKKKGMDKTKRTNHRCQSCKYWNGMTCNNLDSPKYTKPRKYYHSCSHLEWRE